MLWGNWKRFQGVYRVSFQRVVYPIDEVQAEGGELDLKNLP